MKRLVFSCFVAAVLFSNLNAQPGVEPVSRLDYWGYLEHIAVRGDYAFASNTWGVLVFDVSDPADPVMLDHVPIMGDILSLEIHGNILNVGARSFPRFNFSDPENLQLLPDIGAGFGTNSVQAGDNVYGFKNRWLLIADVSDPEEPALIDSVEMDFEVAQMIVVDDL